VNGANRSNNISTRLPRSITTLHSVRIKVAAEAVRTAGAGEVRLLPATAAVEAVVVVVVAATPRAAVIAAVNRV
jgi:hypothetical protein